jgi:hypothetical protein
MFRSKNNNFYASEEKPGRTCPGSSAEDAFFGAEAKKVSGCPPAKFSG